MNPSLIASAAAGGDLRHAFENVAYLVAAVLFILTFKGLSHPRTAVRANAMGAVGMLIAVVVTLFDRHILGYQHIVLGLVVGAAIGATMAVRVQMTAMPQMVGLLNGFGGGASVLVSGAALIDAARPGYVFEADPVQLTVATIAGGLIGGVTFFGSMIAYGKLEEWKFLKSLHFPGQHFVSAALLLTAIGLGVPIVGSLATDAAGVSTLSPEAAYWYWGVVAVASVLGVLSVLPIGGADMPVVICLLNSYSGLAAAATGFVLNNNMLIIAGSLVGASGIILTQIMCKAMNRSMTNVLFGVMEASAAQKSTDAVYARVKSAAPEELAMVFDTAQRVVVVPGYGLAVSQAQHAVRDLCSLLESRGVEVLFGVHPVAGRMPGHMNVLLAEADIAYEKVLEMDDVNARFPETDVAIVIGANDVVNPVARTDPQSPIAGMPILDVDKARTVIVVKRSLSPGFAGIPNPLFAADNTLMYFADGKRAILDLITAIKQS
ncbi:MAG: NAD(P)(+) transhydrogenase (Re/Si-specific) subunit beta [Vicinamibacteria bacterium]|jgi:NAD(P) transhydrogenase subunit beta|nr:NAD(P)(+) transhydrogenase (Re/Si-specific) subunit beta [Vicinamibacteria bacterium]